MPISGYLLDNDELDIDEREDLLVQSPSGHLIDTSGEVWRLAGEGVLSWDRFCAMNRHVLAAAKSYMRHLIRNNALTYVRGQHTFMRSMATEPLLSELNRMIDRDRVLDREFFERFKAIVRETVSEQNISHYTGAFVRWYIWATDAGFSLFDPDVASEFENLRIGRNPIGQAVLSHDENHGPLRDVEMTQLRSSLKAAQLNGTIDLADLTAAWLMVAFGTNPRNLILLEESDYIRTELEDGQIIHELRIPRIKKRTAGTRNQFRIRRMVPEIGELVERLIARNQKERHIEGANRPIFRSERPRRSLVGTPFEREAFRATRDSFYIRLQNLAARLDLRNVSGDRLNLNPRRLRYSFATRLVQEGASIQDVADALDHTSTDFVMVYFNARSDAVRNLDRALSTILAPVAKAFLGKIIRSERDATRAGDPRSRISHLNNKTRKREGLGSCGEYGFCGLFAPLACYTCANFQAWLDGPHEQVLDSLYERRLEKLEEGADPKWTQLHDETILAVTLVVQRCATLKEQGLAA